MSHPQITRRPLGPLYTWETEKVTIDVSKLRNRHESLSGELLVSTTAGGCPGHLYFGTFNFLAVNSRKSLADHLRKVYAEPNWAEILEQLAYHTAEIYREGSPVLELDSASEPVPVTYLIRPLVIEHAPNCIFGDPGSGKSTIALLVSIVALLQLEDNRLNLIPARRCVKSLYLDWESSQQEHEWRLRAFRKGMGWPYVAQYYKRCSLPLYEELDSIMRAVEQFKTELVIIDSLAGAAGGDLNAPESALNFFSALRQLGTTSLVLAHNSKSIESTKKSIFGSLFFTAYFRNTWEMSAFEDTDRDLLSVGLFHRKHNAIARQPDLGYEIAIDGENGSIHVKTADPRVNFMEKLSLEAQIMAGLSRGEQTLSELAEGISQKEGSISTTLGRMKHKGKVDLVAGKWRLME